MCNWLKLSFFIIAILTACGKSLPVLEDIDAEAWKADRNACLHKRTVMKNAVEEQRNKLLALDEKQIIALLGKPDKNELYTRNQKFYTYHLHPAPSCQSSDSISLALIIRFNAMGLAKVVTIE